MNPALVEQPTQTLIQEMVNQSENYPAMGDFAFEVDPQQLFSVSMVQNDQIMAGVIGLIACDWAYMETVWVDDSLRGQGVGKRLMLALESYVQQLGLNGIHLYTSGFQAPGFYPKLSYITMGELPNRPQGYDATYFYKTDLSPHHLTDEFVVEHPVTEATFDYLDEQLESDAEKTEPVDSHERAFVLNDDEKTMCGGIYGNEFWGWFDVFLCYATTPDEINTLLDALESYCDRKKLGILLPVYDDIQGEMLKTREYQVFGILPNRPTGKTCTVWIRPQPKI